MMCRLSRRQEVRSAQQYQGGKTRWHLEREIDLARFLEPNEESEIKIESKRIDTVPGTHIVEYESHVDSIEIKHTAHNREGFALGAVVAAEWIIGKTGVFSMRDVLNLG